MRPLTSPERLEQNHEIRAHVTASVQFVLLLVVLILSVLENLFLFLISFSSVHRWCREFYLRRQYREVVNFIGPVNKIGSRKNSTTFERVQFRMRSASEAADYLATINSHKGSLQTSAPDEYCSVVDGEESFDNPGTNVTTSASVNCIGNITRYYFANLCFANLLLALLAMPFSIAASVGTSNKPPETLSLQSVPGYNRVLHHDNIILDYPLIISDAMCTFIESVVSGILMVTALCLVQLTADRLMAICMPLHYARLVTRRRAMISIGVVWITAGIFISIPHLFTMALRWHTANETLTYGSADRDMYRCFILGQQDEGRNWKKAIMYFLIAFLLPFIFIVAAYVKINLTVKKCVKQLIYGNIIQPKCSITQSISRSNSTSHVFLSNPFTIPLETTDKCSRHQSYTLDQFSSLNRRKQNDTPSLVKERRHQKIQTKASKTASMLVCTFFSLTAPYFIFSLIGPLLTVHSTIISEHENFDEIMELISSIIVWLLYVNSVLTPGLYALRDGVLRRRIVGIWRWRKKRQSSNIVRFSLE